MSRTTKPPLALPPDVVADVIALIETAIERSVDTEHYALDAARVQRAKAWVLMVARSRRGRRKAKP